MTEQDQQAVAETIICECLRCGRLHHRLGSPPWWTISHEDACRLSRLFNAQARLDRPQDQQINEWLKRLISSVREPS